MKHDAYLNYEGLTKTLKEVAQKFPKLAKLSSLGQSEEGREMWLLTVTDFETGKPADKPAIWVDGNTHATELSGCQACLHTIDFLTSNSKFDTQISELLKKTTFYFLPRISVDGAEFIFKNNMRVRSSPQIFPGDDPKENFQRKDMNGDGEVLFMRIKDPSGFYKISPDDPRLMIPRESFDFSENDGPFYHVIPEGEFLNYDGFSKRYLEKMRFDLNRQSPNLFSPKEYGAGPLPMYLKEGQILARAIVDRPNIVTAVTHHTYGGFLLRPSSLRADSELPTNDLDVYKLMGKIGEKITGYQAISVYHDFRYNPKEVTTGAWDDWHYDHRGIFSWTPEIWSLPTHIGIKLEKPMDIYQNQGTENLIKILQWCDQNLEKDSFFMNWTFFQHPQLGVVELGGWKTLYTWSNPPAKLLLPEIEKLTNFTIRLAQMCPFLEFKNIEVKKIEKNIFSLKVSVQNTGFLPTYISDTAKSLKVYKSPQALLKLAKDQSLLQGKEETFVRHLTGRAQILPLNSAVSGSSVDNTYEDQFSWVIQGEGSLEFEVSYHGAGKLKRVIDLKP